MRNGLRTSMEVLNSVILLFGTIFSLYGLYVARHDYLTSEAGHRLEWWRFGGWNALSVGGTSLVWLTASIAFGFVFIRRGANILSPLIYVLSCAFLGFSFFPTLLSIGKADNFLDAEHILTLGGTFAALSCAFAGLGLLWNYKMSSRS